MIDRHNTDRASYRRSTCLATQKICEALGSPKALSLSIVCSSILDGTIKDGQELRDSLNAITSFNPADYLAGDERLFRDDYCASQLWSKIPPLFENDESYLKQQASETFAAVERDMQGFTESILNGSFTTATRDCASLYDVRRMLKRILGRAPSWGTIIEKGGWGPGSSYRLSKLDASPELKCEYEDTVTLPLLRKLSETGALALFPYPKSWSLVPGNLITTVPKNYKTDRTIAIEPGLNAWCQKGIGSVIRRRLRKFNINLNDQRFNMLAAQEALVHDFVTIDLKAASDSICFALLELILPSDWFELIKVSRSERGSWDCRNGKNKTWVDYYKVSSMGNGFTFELESAIFFSLLLASGVPLELCYVYGDDIIVPKQFASDVVKTLGTYGFHINTEKSYLDGLFYESCGSYSFNGVDVTPIKMKEVLHGSKDIIVLANKVRLFANLCGDGWYCERRFLSAWRHLLSRLDSSSSSYVRGPVGSGLTLFTTFEEAPHAYYKDGFFRFFTVEPLINKRTADFNSLLKYRIGQLSASLESSLYDDSLSKSSCGNVVKQTMKGAYWLPSPKYVKGKLKKPYPNSRTEQWNSPGVWR